MPGTRPWPQKRARSDRAGVWARGQLQGDPQGARRHYLRHNEYFHITSLLCVPSARPSASTLRQCPLGQPLSHSMLGASLFVRQGLAGCSQRSGVWRICWMLLCSTPRGVIGQTRGCASADRRWRKRSARKAIGAWCLAPSSRPARKTTLILWAARFSRTSRHPRECLPMMPVRHFSHRVPPKLCGIETRQGQEPFLICFRAQLLIRRRDASHMHACDFSLQPASAPDVRYLPPAVLITSRRPNSAGKRVHPRPRRRHHLLSSETGWARRVHFDKVVCRTLGLARRCVQ